MRPSRKHLLVLLLIWALAAAYLAARFDSGWIPHDEGTLAQAAERVLRGELPHRDFDDPYVGGLAFLHALSFQLFGTRLLSTRIMLLLAMLALVPAIYAIARRASSPWLAGLITLLCLVWGPANYFAGVPSWYNLICACLGTLCLMRFVETDRRRWVFAAGLCGGLSVLIKQVGLYYLAAAFLFLVYHEQVVANRGQRGRGRGYGLFVKVSLALFGIALVGLTLRRASPMGALHFVLPGVATAGFIWWNESRLGDREGVRRWRVLRRMTLPFALGAIGPIVLFAAPYALTSSLDSLYRGVLIAPRRRFEYASLALPEPWTLVAILPMALLLAAGRWLAGRTIQRVLLVPAVLLSGFLLLIGGDVAAYHGVWYSVRPLVPLVAIAGCLLLVWPGTVGRLGARQSQHLFLLVAITATTGLVQYPFAAGVYFCYIAPLVILALHFLVASQSRAPKLLHGCLLAFYLLWAMMWLNSADTFQLGFGYRPAPRMERLDVDRGGLRVPSSDAKLYRDLVAEIQHLTPTGGSIYATPDSPEVYFLSARKNPTRTFFDLFDDDYGGDPLARSARILGILDRRGINVVVLHRRTEFSHLSPVLERQLRDRFPRQRDLGPITLMWRGPAGQVDALRSSPRMLDIDSRVLPSRSARVAGSRGRTNPMPPGAACGGLLRARSGGPACPF